MKSNTHPSGRSDETRDRNAVVLSTTAGTSGSGAEKRGLYTAELARGGRLIADFHEGRILAIGCIGCQQDVIAALELGQSVRMYVAAIACPECAEQLVQFDIISGEVQCAFRGF